MSLNGALRIIAARWQDISTLLTVRELEGVYALTSTQNHDSASSVFQILSRVLPPEDPAWYEFGRLQRKGMGGSDPEPEDSPEALTESVRLLDGALETSLTAPTIELERDADRIAAEAQARLTAVDPIPGPSDSRFLIVLSSEGRTSLPSFQFLDNGDPRHIVLVVNAMLSADQDPRGVGDWWLGGNTWLGGVSPASLLGTPREPEVLLAAEQITSDSW